MVRDNSYGLLVFRMEELIADLDRLELAIVAVHVDVALTRLREIMVAENLTEVIQQN